MLKAMGNVLYHQEKLLQELWELNHIVQKQKMPF